MSRLRLVIASGAVPSLISLLLALSACGGSSPSAPGPTPSYALAASALNPSSVTAGNNSSSSITVTPANGYTGSVSLSCGSIAGGSAAPTCSFSTNPVIISGTASGTSTLTVSTSTSTAGGNYAISVTGKDAASSAPSNGPQALNLTIAAVIQRVVVIFQENRTPDNLFQDPVLISRGADIVSSGVNSLGQTIPLGPID